MISALIGKSGRLAILVEDLSFFDSQPLMQPWSLASNSSPTLDCGHRKYRISAATKGCAGLKEHCNLRLRWSPHTRHVPHQRIAGCELPGVSALPERCTHVSVSNIHRASKSKKALSVSKTVAHLSQELGKGEWKKLERTGIDPQGLLWSQLAEMIFKKLKM